MKVEKYINLRVKYYYHIKYISCTQTVLRILSKLFSLKLNKQVFYGAQCGLIEGVLMFIGLLGNSRGYSREDIEAVCFEFAEGFEKKLGSLICRELRPEGFKEDNPPIFVN